MYVAGFERGVRPIGDWSMSMTLSMCSAPSMRSCDADRCAAVRRPSSSLVLVGFAAAVGLRRKPFHEDVVDERDSCPSR